MQGFIGRTFFGWDTDISNASKVAHLRLFRHHTLRTLATVLSRSFRKFFNWAVASKQVRDTGIWDSDGCCIMLIKGCIHPLLSHLGIDFLRFAMGFCNSPRSPVSTGFDRRPVSRPQQEPPCCPPEGFASLPHWI